MLLKTYMKRRNLKDAEMAKLLGRKRQNVEQWVAKKSTIQLGDTEYRVSLPNGLVVHPAQVNT